MYISTLSAVDAEGPEAGEEALLCREVGASPPASHLAQCPLWASVCVSGNVYNCACKWTCDVVPVGTAASPGTLGTEGHPATPCLDPMSASLLRPLICSPLFSVPSLQALRGPLDEKIINHRLIFQGLHPVLLAKLKIFAMCRVASGRSARG